MGRDSLNHVPLLLWNKIGYRFYAICGVQKIDLKKLKPENVTGKDVIHVKKTVIHVGKGKKRS